MGTILFRDTAVTPFTIRGDGTMTCSSSVNYWGRQVPSANDPATWGVYSQSDLPQTIATGTLRNGLQLSVAAAGVGPVVVNSSLACGSSGYGNIHIGGDVRFAKSGLTVPRIVMPSIGGGDARLGSRLTLLSGADMTVSTQDGKIAYDGNDQSMFSDGASLNIVEGATLTFAAGSGAVYKWKCSQPGKSIIDGTLNILAPYVNAANVVYGGSGRINVSEFRCSSAAGSLGLAGSVNLYPPAAWNTVDSYGVNAPFILRAYDAPTVHLSDDWTYGPASAVAGTTTSAASDRACVIADGAALTIEAGGHVGTFVDPVSGRGTLTVTNGTLKLAAVCDPQLSLAVRNGGSLAWSVPMSVVGLEMDCGATLRFMLDAPLTVEGDIHIDGDPNWLMRLSKILIDNACKYAAPGTTIDVKLSRASGHVTLSVTNQGNVIDPEDLPHLFDRFYRSDKARDRETGGFGLGLAIAKGIAEAHGGTISATSTAEAGTTFTVTL